LSKSKTEISDQLEASSSRDENFEALLLYLKQSRGFDFTAYKRSSLMRRVLVRMQAAGISTFPEFHDYLQVDPDEFTRLFNTILINVTSFFRDPPVWAALAETVIPALLAEKRLTRSPCSSRRLWAPNSFGTESRSTARMWTKRRSLRRGSDHTRVARSRRSPLSCCRSISIV
jgi:two-component system CheB/CheR fusion protein